MRDYGKISPRLWTGETGKAIRAQGRDAQVIAFYLLTCPSANMIGLYYLPMPMLSHETGIPIQGARKALRRVVDAGFAAYSESEEVVWVPEMARHQIGEELKEKDNLVKFIAKEAALYSKSAFFKEFIDRYGKAYHIKKTAVERIAEQAPSKPLRSQEQEQEQEQEQDKKPLSLKSDGFDSFWKEWPIHKRKKGRSKCLRLWERKNLHTMADAIVAAAKRFKISHDWTKENGKYIPGPESWLNDESWEVPPETLAAAEFTPEAPRRKPDATDLAIAYGANGEIP